MKLFLGNRCSFRKRNISGGFQFKIRFGESYFMFLGVINEFSFDIRNAIYFSVLALFSVVYLGGQRLAPALRVEVMKVLYLPSVQAPPLKVLRDLASRHSPLAESTGSAHYGSSSHNHLGID